MRSFFELNPTQRSSLRKGFLFGGLKLNSSVSLLKKRVGSFAPEVHAYLQKLANMGVDKALVVHLLEVTTQITEDMQIDADTLQSKENANLVMTSPKNPQKLLSYKEAAVDILKQAKKTVWISTFSFHKSNLCKPNPQSMPVEFLQEDFSLFKDLLAHLQNKPYLKISLLVQCLPPQDDERSYDDLVADLSYGIEKIWPSHVPLPKLYHDPSRHLKHNNPYVKTIRRSQHSKVIVVDDHLALVGSANLSHAGYEYNLEVGCRIQCEEQVKELVDQFKFLIAEKKLVEIPIFKSSSQTQESSLNSGQTSTSSQESPIQETSWWNLVNKNEIGAESYELLVKLVQKHPILHTTSPLILEEIEVEQFDYDPTMSWLDYKIAIYHEVHNPFIDDSLIKQGQLDEVEQLRQHEWCVCLVNSESDFDLLISQVTAHLNTIID